MSISSPVKGEGISNSLSSNNNAFSHLIFICIFSMIVLKALCSSSKQVEQGLCFARACFGLFKHSTLGGGGTRQEK